MSLEATEEAVFSTNKIIVNRSESLWNEHVTMAGKFCWPNWRNSHRHCFDICPRSLCKLNEIQSKIKGECFYVYEYRGWILWWQIFKLFIVKLFLLPFGYFCWKVPLFCWLKNFFKCFNLKLLNVLKLLLLNVLVSNFSECFKLEPFRML